MQKVTIDLVLALNFEICESIAPIKMKLLPHDISGHSVISSACDTDSNRIILEQKRVRLRKLHHAATCSFAMSGQTCPSELRCAALRRLYLHVISCTCKGACAVPGCDKSQFMWRHYRACKTETCLFCVAVPTPDKPMVIYRSNNPSVKVVHENAPNKSFAPLLPKTIPNHYPMHIAQAQPPTSARRNFGTNNSTNICREVLHQTIRSDDYADDGPPKIESRLLSARMLMLDSCKAQNFQKSLCPRDSSETVVESLALIPPPPPPPSPPPLPSDIANRRRILEKATSKIESARKTDEDQPIRTAPIKPLGIGRRLLCKISEYGIEIFLGPDEDLNCASEDGTRLRREKTQWPQSARAAQGLGRPPLPTPAQWFAA